MATDRPSSVADLAVELMTQSDFQGVSDSYLVKARLTRLTSRQGGDSQARKTPPSRWRTGAAKRSNRFVRGASPGISRAQAEFARRRREASLQAELYKIGPTASPAACPAWPLAHESPFTSISPASAEIAPRRHFERMRSVTEQPNVEIFQDSAPADFLRTEAFLLCDCGKFPSF